jgi:hypothetical protein
VLASLVLCKEPKEIEITGCEIGIVRTVVLNIPPLVPQPITTAGWQYLAWWFPFLWTHKVRKTGK